MRLLVPLVAVLLCAPASLAAQTVITLGKPTPNAQNEIIANVQTPVGALPATSAACTWPAPAGTGQYEVVFAASPDHSVLEHGTPKVASYELVVQSPTQTQPCYLAFARSVGPGGTASGPLSDPFVLRPGTPAAPGSRPVIMRR